MILINATKSEQIPHSAAVRATVTWSSLSNIPTGYSPLCVAYFGANKFLRFFPFIPFSLTYIEIAASFCSRLLFLFLLLLSTDKTI